MEFTGQIIKVFEPRSGVSERTGNEWKTQGFVFEFKEHETDPWHDKVYLETFDINVMPSLVEGAVAKIDFRHSTREYNGRAYNDVRMNSFTLVGKPMSGAQQPAGGNNDAQANNNPQPQQNAATDGENQGGESDGLPF